MLSGHLDGVPLVPVGQQRPSPSRRTCIVKTAFAPSKAILSGPWPKMFSILRAKVQRPPSLRKVATARLSELAVGSAWNRTIAMAASPSGP